jgi:hypothetical protein
MLCQTKEASQKDLPTDYTEHIEPNRLVRLWLANACPSLIFLVDTFIYQGGALSSDSGLDGSFTNVMKNALAYCKKVLIRSKK